MYRMRTLFVATLASLLTLPFAVAQNEAAPQPGFGRGPGQGLALYQLGDHAVQMTDTGAVITITSADPAVAQRLIALHMGANRPMLGQPAGVTRTVEALDNGVRITLVGATPEDVQWIQERHATVPAGPPADVQRPLNGQGRGWAGGQAPGFGRAQGGYGCCGGPGLGLAVGPAAGFPAPNHAVENIANGVRVTITSTNADQIALLQQRAAPGILNCPYANRIQTDVQTIAEGVVITMTSEDPDTVAWLQANPPTGPRGNGAGLAQGAGFGQGQGRGRGRGAGRGWRRNQ